MSSGFTIRGACAGDLDAVLAISNHYAATTPANFAVEPEPMAAWRAAFASTSERFPWLVAVDDGDGVVGFAKASPWKGRCAYAHSVEISAYVADTHRGQGIGRALYAVLIPALRRQGYHSVVAGITLPNPASVRLHESFGLEPVGTFTQIGWKFGRWHDVGYWMLHLAPPGATPASIRPVGEVLVVPGQ